MLKSYSKTINSGDHWFIDIATAHGGVSGFTQISNLSTDISAKLTINNEATISLPAASTQVFNRGDLLITSLTFTAPAAPAPVPIEVLLAID